MSIDNNEVTNIIRLKIEVKESKTKPKNNVDAIEDLLVIIHRDLYDACKEKKIDYDLGKKIRSNLAKIQQLFQKVDWNTEN